MPAGSVLRAPCAAGVFCEAMRASEPLSLDHKRGGRVSPRSFHQAVSTAAKDAYVLATMVNEEAAIYFLPLYLRSMRTVASQNGSELVRQALVMTLDDKAQEICSSIHFADLCCPARLLGGDESSQAFESRFVAQDGEHTHAYQAMGFMKVKIMLEAVTLGYHILFLDVDQIVLKNPFAHMNLDNDIIAARDCNLLDHTCYTKLINLGVVFFKNTPTSREMLTDWYSRRHTGWDQAVFISMVVGKDGEAPPYSASRLDF